MKPLTASTRHSRLLALAGILVLTAACGAKGPRIEVTPHFSLSEKSDPGFAEENSEKLKGYHSTSIIKNRDRTYASINLYLSDNPDQKPLQIDLKRHDRAYLAETTLYQQDTFATYISVGMDKDSKYVAGLRMRWSF